MNEYTVVVFAAAAMVSVAGFAFYSEKQESMMRISLGIIFICAVISPLVSMVRGIADMDFTQGESFAVDNVYEKTAEEAFCRGVMLALAEEFSLSKEEVSVKTYGFSAESISCERISVTLSGKACFADTLAIRTFIEDNNWGKCEVKLEFG